jgi:hypothetical protein
MVSPVRVDEQLPVAGAAFAGQAEVAVFAEGLVPEKIAALMVTDIPAPQGQSAGQIHYLQKI